MLFHEQHKVADKNLVPTFQERGQPRVLLVGNFLSGPTGTRGLSEDFAGALKAAGWSVLTTSSQPGRLARILDFLLTVWGQRHRYSVAHVDVYSGLAFKWAELVCWALRMAKKPYALTLRGGNLPEFARSSDKRVQHLLRSASAVTAPSKYLLEQMRQFRPDIALLPNPLDLPSYPFHLRQQPSANLVWLRAFHDIYNPSLAVRVVALLAQEFPGVRLVMVGPDKGDGSHQTTRDLALQLGVSDRVRYTGPVAKNQIAYWLNQSDIFLNTTRIDNTPVSVLEAMACGLCIVSTNVGGIPYLLEDNRDALLVPSDDPFLMAQAIKRILIEKGLAETLSTNARRKAESVDWKEILPKWESLFSNIVQGYCNGRQTS